MKCVDNPQIPLVSVWAVKTGRCEYCLQVRGQKEEHLFLVADLDVIKEHADGSHPLGSTFLVRWMCGQCLLREATQQAEGLDSCDARSLIRNGDTPTMQFDDKVTAKVFDWLPEQLIRRRYE